MSRHYRVCQSGMTYFITSTIHLWIPVFCRDDYFQVMIESLNYCARHKELQIHGYVIMLNHFHVLCTQNSGKLSDAMRDLKTYTSKVLAHKLEEDGRSLWLSAMLRTSRSSKHVQIWQEAFHPEQIYSKAFFDQKLEYVHNNPVRAGFVVDPCDWKYSSASYYIEGVEPQVAITLLEW